MYQIKGIEYYKEGYLDLEPLLHYDEYKLEGEYDKEVFDKQQRKDKMLRLKQYV